MITGPFDGQFLHALEEVCSLGENSYAKTYITSLSNCKKVTGQERSGVNKVTYDMSSLFHSNKKAIQIALSVV